MLKYQVHEGQSVFHHSPQKGRLGQSGDSELMTFISLEMVIRLPCLVSNKDTGQFGKLELSGVSKLISYM